MKDSIGEFDEYLTEHVCTPMTGKYYLYTWLLFNPPARLTTCSAAVSYLYYIYLLLNDFYQTNNFYLRILPYRSSPNL